MDQCSMGSQLKHYHNCTRNCYFLGLSTCDPNGLSRKTTIGLILLFASHARSPVRNHIRRENLSSLGSEKLCLIEDDAADVLK